MALEAEDPTCLTGIFKFTYVEEATGLFNCSLLGRLLLDLSDGDGLKSDWNKAFGVILRGDVSQLPAIYLPSNFCEGGLNTFCVIRSSNFAYFEKLCDGFSE